jgi:hypothetical protein
MRTIVCLLAMAALAGLATAQPTSFVVNQPDCIININFNTLNQTAPTAPNAGLNNIATGCTTWEVVASANAGVTGFTLALQSAPNNGGVPGAYVTFANPTVIAGANPIIGVGAGAAGLVWLTGYNPWVQVQLTALAGAGTVNGAAYGWRIPSASSTTGGTGNVNIASVGGNTVTTTLPVTQSAGCTHVGIASSSASGAIQVVPLSGTSKVRVCSAYIQVVQPNTLPADFGLVTGTGVNCAGAQANLTQQWAGIAATVQSFTQQLDAANYEEGPAGAAVCMLLSAAPTAARVQVNYDYY